MFRLSVVKSPMSNSRIAGIISSWQLFLLGATGIVLSIASGWTTWNGLSNFTQEPLLSFMITFGIQGVMLIAAWFIGESFVTEKAKNHAGRPGRTRQLWLIRDRRTGALVVLGLGLTLLLVVGLFVVFRNDLERLWSAQSDDFKHILAAALLMALLLVTVGRNIIGNYLQSIRVVAKNVVLWIMFLACMATSVFFSFDSLFSTIFSETERQRAADLRTRSEVASIMNDVVDLATRRQLERRTELLNSGEWSAYSRILHQLETELQAAPEVVTKFLQQRAASAQEGIASRQAKLSSIETQISQLSRKQQQLSQRHEQLKGQAEGLETTIKTLDRQIFEKDREIITKSAEAEAEANGIGVTSKPGRGPKYLALINQMKRFEQEKLNLELQSKAYKERVATARQALAGAESELATTKAARLQLVAKVSAVNKTAEPDQISTEASLLRSNLKTALQSLKEDRLAYVQNPTKVGLGKLQVHCSTILDLVSRSHLLTSEIRPNACEPGKVHEAATRLYALNIGAAAMNVSCRLNANSPNSGGVKEQLGLARSCLQTSRLLPVDESTIRAKIDGLERKRDDLAHRFVVTINAFSDGNFLAYLALAIAIAIDALVFMSGLFGANAAAAIRSTAPEEDDRSDRQPEILLQSALLPDVFGNATAILAAASPIVETRGSNLSPEWTHEIDITDGRIAEQSRLQMPLNAGVAAGIVQCDARYPDRYYLKAEFIKLLCQAAQLGFTNDQKSEGVSRLISEARIVLRYLRPASAIDDYSFQLEMSEVQPDDVDVTERCLKALAPLNCLHSVEHEGETVRYLVHKDLHRVLTFLAAGPASVSVEPQQNENALVANGIAAYEQNGAALGINHEEQGSATVTRIPPPVRTLGTAYRDAYRRYKSAQQN